MRKNFSKKDNYHADVSLAEIKLQVYACFGIKK